MARLLYNNQFGSLVTSGTDVTNSTTATVINFATAPDFATIVNAQDYIPIILNAGSTVPAGQPGAFEIVWMIGYTATQTYGTVIRAAEDGTNWPAATHPGGSWTCAPAVFDKQIAPTLTQFLTLPQLISAVPSLVGTALTLNLASAMSLTVGDYLNISGATNGGGGTNWPNINGDWIIIEVGSTTTVGAVVSSTTVVVTFTGVAPSGAYTASSATATPDFVPTITGQYEIECIGGGGGGGGAGSSAHSSGTPTQAGGGGGSQGASVRGIQTLIEGTPYQCSVGAGGGTASGGASGGNAGTNGHNGGNTLFSGPTAIYAPGGGGGDPSAATSANPVQGASYGNPVSGNAWYPPQTNATHAGDGGGGSSVIAQGGVGAGAPVGSGAGGGQAGATATASLGGAGGSGGSLATSTQYGQNNSNTATASGSAGGTGAQPGGGGGGGGGGSEGASASGVGGSGGAGAAGGIIIRGPFSPMVASGAGQ
jgi:hypothetical protein